MYNFDIDVPQIVREQFTNELEASGVFNSIVPDGGDGEIELRVLIYGFVHDFGGKLKPMMGIEGSLLTSDESVVWKKYAYVTNLCKETPECSIEQFTSYPESVREAF